MRSFLFFVTEAATLDKSSIRNAVSIAPNSTVDSTLSPVTMAPSTSSQAHEETRSTTRTDPHLTTTEGGSHIVNTNEPKDNDTLKIHIATGITALLGVIVICIGLVSIMKCIQAKSAKGGQTATGTEQPQVVVSSSNGALLQENTVHRKLMASWSSEKIGYEGGRNCNSEQWQNTSNSDHHVMVTMPTKEHSKHDDGTEPQDKPDSSGIVVQENTAYERSTDSVDTATQETTSSVQNTDIDVNQCSTSSSGIAVHKNTAYKKSTNGGDTVAEYEVMDETDEQVMQQNQAYGFQGESQEGTESANAGDYETMTGDSVYDYGSQTNGREDEKTTPAEPVMYDMPIQQQNTNPEDSEHSYDYII